MTIPNSKFVKLNQNRISVENHGKSPKCKFKVGHFKLKTDIEQQLDIFNDVEKARMQIFKNMHTI